MRRFITPTPTFGFSKYRISIRFTFHVLPTTPPPTSSIVHCTPPSHTRASAVFYDVSLGNRRREHTRFRLRQFTAFALSLTCAIRIVSYIFVAVSRNFLILQLVSCSGRFSAISCNFVRRFTRVIRVAPHPIPVSRPLSALYTAINWRPHVYQSFAHHLCSSHKIHGITPNLQIHVFRSRTPCMHRTPCAHRNQCRPPMHSTVLPLRFVDNSLPPLPRFIHNGRPRPASVAASNADVFERANRALGIPQT